MSPTSISTSSAPSSAPASSQHATAQPTAPVEHVDPRHVAQWLKEGRAVLIDVREPDEHARESIKGAALHPLSKFDARQALARAGAGQRVVFHCKSGRRSADAARIAAALAQTGCTVCTMTGGIEAWKQQGLSVSLDTSVSGISIMRQVQLIVGIGTLLGTVLAWLVSPWFLLLTAFWGAGMTFAGASGTCALASLLGVAPWNRRPATAGTASTASSPATSRSCCSGERHAP